MLQNCFDDQERAKGEEGNSAIHAADQKQYQSSTHQHPHLSPAEKNEQHNEQSQKHLIENFTPVANDRKLSLLEVPSFFGTLEPTKKSKDEPTSCFRTSSGHRPLKKSRNVRFFHSLKEHEPPSSEMSPPASIRRRSTSQSGIDDNNPHHHLQSLLEPAVVIGEVPLKPDSIVFATSQQRKTSGDQRGRRKSGACLQMFCSKGLRLLPFSIFSKKRELRPFAGRVLGNLSLWFYHSSQINSIHLSSIHLFIRTLQLAFINLYYYESSYFYVRLLINIK